MLAERRPTDMTLSRANLKSEKLYEARKTNGMANGRAARISDGASSRGCKESARKSS
jgi:hypothetical protein